jgi:phage shock protein PspC (stress-responsive transcriptional regulator)
MNKTININIGGFPFVIDEGAYDTLQHYLENIKRHFSRSEDADEIVSDIESRIAELFIQFLGSRQIVNNADVTKMIGVMGTPEDFGAESKGTDFKNSNNTFKTGKRLFRDPDDKIVGGVCSGISSYLGIEDPIWLRAAFAISFFVFGSGFFVYIILLIILPKAESAADRLSMKGEHINIENIAKIVEDGVNHISSTLNEVGNNLSGDAHSKSDTKHKLNSTLSNIVATLGKVFIALLAVINPFLKLIGIVLIFSLGIVLLALFIGLVFGFPLTDYFFDGNTFLGGLTFANLFFLIGIPILGSIIILSKMLFNHRYTPKFSNGLKIFFGINFAALFFLLPFGLKNFSKSASITNELDVSAIHSDTLNVKLNKTDFDEININFGDIGIKEDFIEISNCINLKFETTDDSLFTIAKTITCRGKNEEQAKKNARNTVCNLDLKGNELILDKTFLIPKGTQWRGQRINVVVKVPNGKVVGMNNSTFDFADEMNTEFDNEEDWRDDDIKYFKSNNSKNLFEYN